MKCSNCRATPVPVRTTNYYCATCFARWDRAGRPDTGPPPPQASRYPAASTALGRAALTAATEEQMLRYADVRRKRFTVKQAAWVMGLGVSTAYRYDRVLRERGVVLWPPTHSHPSFEGVRPCLSASR